MERPAQLEIVPATAQHEPVLANLLELYAHDFSEFYDVELGPDGRFGYKDLPLYWHEPGRHAFLVKLDGTWAGFVLIALVAAKAAAGGTVWDVGEFFVARRYRRRGFGTEIAHQVWTRFPGAWEVRVMEANHRALPFWQRAISAFTGETSTSIQIENDGQFWNLFSFQSPPVP